VTDLPATGVRRLPRRLRGSWRLLLRELGAFGVVGFGCFFLDVALFQLLYAVLGTAPVLAKLISTLVSMTAAYVGHRYWSFASRPRTGLRRESLLFAAVNGLTLLMGLAVMWLVHVPLGQDSALVLQAANIGAIALGTAVRYVSYRTWVFPVHGSRQPEAAIHQAGEAAALRKTA
jgi:putative flippase GtrA